MTQHPPKVFRSFALPLATFDYLKQFQRRYLEQHSVHLNNNEAIALILDQHKQSQNVESEERSNGTEQPRNDPSRSL